MNVYDTANKLGYEIQDSEEYKSYKKIKNEVMTDLELKEKIEAFEKLRYDVQLMQYTGEDRDEEKAKKLEEMYNMLIVNNKVKEYFDLETNVDVIVGGALCLENKYEEKNEEYLISHSQYMLIGRIEKINVGNNQLNS